MNTLAVIHRRAGKDVFCMEAWVLRGLMRIGTHVYLFPQLNQARSVIWNGMDYSGKPFMDAIPNQLIEKKNDARMEIKLINGSRLVLGGSNNYDALMGSNPVTIIYSEYALHHPLARQYLNPILIQNDGIEIVQSTPRGKNHLFDLYEVVKTNPRYHVEHLSVKETTKQDGTPIITEAHLTEAKKMGMSDEMIEQEFMVSFDVGNQGAYFTRELAEMERRNGIRPLAVNPRLPLHSAWDLGGTDATAGWLFQIDGQNINLLFCLHDSGFGLKHYLDMAEQIRRQTGCEWGMHFMPHDVKQEHQGWESTESRLTIARRHGWILNVTPKVAFEDGIEAMRHALKFTQIDPQTCNIGLRGLREYQRHRDELKQIYTGKPLDNWATHIADAYRYLAVNFKKLWLVPMSQTSYTSSL